MSDHRFIPKSNSKIVPPFIPKPKESLEAENARLKAEVERLRESGSSIISILCQHVADSNLRNLALREWNAAKEGKQP